MGQKGETLHTEPARSQREACVPQSGERSFLIAATLSWKNLEGCLAQSRSK